jgi:hypothetical protein
MPDFRFVLGAILAIAVLGVTGFGLAVSVRLAHEARMRALEPGRSLAFAAPAERNPFYDPDGARRLEGSAGRTEALGATYLEALEAPSEALPAAEPPGERTASIPAVPPEASPAEVTAKIDPARVNEPAPAATIAAAPAIAAGTPESEAPDKIGAGEPPAEPDRVASLLAASPASDFGKETEMPAPPQTASDSVPHLVPPIPRARPKPQTRARIARAHFRRTGASSQQAYSGFPNAQWPGYGNQFNSGRVR